MRQEDFQYLLDTKGIPALLSELKWSSLAPFISDYREANTDILFAQLLAGDLRCFICPIAAVPFELHEKMQLAALSPRLESRYHLLNKTQTKNLAFFSESDVLFYSDPLVKDFVRMNNEKVQLEKIEIGALAQKDLSIHPSSYWSVNDLQALNEQEFTPRVGEGIYVLVCMKTDRDLRQLAPKLHSISSLSLSNIERQFQKHFESLDAFVTVNARTDVNNNFHATVVFRKDAELTHIQFSQSTSHRFLENFLQEYPH